MIFFVYQVSSKCYFEISKWIFYGFILFIKDGKILYFDILFKKYVKDIDWDWCILVFLVYMELNFDIIVVLWVGVKGLMQFMFWMVCVMGVFFGKEQNLEESIKVVVKYIVVIFCFFNVIKDENEWMKFVLVVYNVGIGYVLDVMVLVEKYGKNKYVWNNSVDNYILFKSNEEYFNDLVCKNGYF